MQQCVALYWYDTLHCIDVLCIAELQLCSGVAGVNDPPTRSRGHSPRAPQIWNSPTTIPGQNTLEPAIQDSSEILNSMESLNTSSNTYVEICFHRLSYHHTICVTGFILCKLSSMIRSTFISASEFSLLLFKVLNEINIIIQY